MFGKKELVTMEKFKLENAWLRETIYNAKEKIQRLEKIVLTLAEKGEASFWVAGGHTTYLRFSSPPTVEPCEEAITRDGYRKLTIRISQKQNVRRKKT